MVWDLHLRYWLISPAGHICSEAKGYTYIISLSALLLSTSSLFMLPMCATLHLHLTASLCTFIFFILSSAFQSQRGVNHHPCLESTGGFILRVLRADASRLQISLLCLSAKDFLTRLNYHIVCSNNQICSNLIHLSLMIKILAVVSLHTYKSFWYIF